MTDIFDTLAVARHNAKPLTESQVADLSPYDTNAAAKIDGRLVTAPPRTWPNTSQGECDFNNRPDWADMREVTRRLLDLRPRGH